MDFSRKWAWDNDEQSVMDAGTLLWVNGFTPD